MAVPVSKRRNSGNAARARSLIISVTFLLSGLLRDPSTQAQEAPASEYQVEAAFLYHFAEFVVWPAEAFPKPGTPFVVGVLGDNPFGGALQEAIRDKAINGHPMQLMLFESRSLGELDHCHIVFISPSERKRLPDILQALKDKSVLTVGRMDRFTEWGGMINFFIEGKRVRFEINDEAARKAGLKISAKLLTLARKKNS